MKIRQWGLENNEIERALEYLVDEKYIDNIRFSRAYCLDKLRYNHWGRIKIQQMLHHLGLSSQEIQEGLSAIEEEEYESILLDVANVRLRTLHDEDAFTRQGKLIRHLLSRDFKIDFVMKHLPTQS